MSRPRSALYSVAAVLGAGAVAAVAAWGIVPHGMGILTSSNEPIAADGQERVQLRWDEAVNFLAQHECGNDALPVEPACVGGAPLREGQTPAYRRLDGSGTQATDALVARRAGGDVVIQTFDFGDSPRAFGRFDEGKGDGADAVRLDAGGISIYATEDGGAGLQFWAGAPCPAVAGWLLWDAPLRRDWTARTVRIGLARSLGECPVLGASWTRWRLVDATVPWNASDGRAGTWTGPAVLTDHFGTGSPDTADHVERFLNARGLGKVLWERWEHRTRSMVPPARRAELRRVAAVDGRCAPPVGGLEPLGSEWERTDCRLWTRFALGAGPAMPWRP